MFCSAMAIALLSAPAGASAADRDEQELAEVLVTARHVDTAAQPTEQMEKLSQVPGTLGDALQSVFSLPGIVPTMEYGGQPAVRGSGPDDNTYLIDFLPVGYLFHDFGDSIVSEDLLRDFGVQTAGFGARYGDATGGLFDIHLREPRQQPLHTTLELSFLRAGAMVERSAGEDQSFYALYRESLIGMALRTQRSKLKKDEDLSFDKYPQARDFTGKFSWRPGNRDRVSLLFIGAQDITTLNVGSNSDFALIDPAAEGDASIDTAFGSAGLHWTHDDEGWNAEGGLGVMRLRRRDELAGGNEFVHLHLTQWTAKLRGELQLDERQRIATGVEAIRRLYGYTGHIRYRPCSVFTPDCLTEHGDMLDLKDRLPMDTVAVFAEHAWTPRAALTVTTGLRQSWNRYLREWHTEPRLAATLSLSPAWSMHSAIGRYHQLPEVPQMAPTLGNPAVKAPGAWHYVLGVKQQLGQGWSWTADAYYKNLDQVIIDTTAPLLYDNLAHGETWGTELMLDKAETGRWYGWASLSVSRSRRTSTTSGETIRFNFDTPVVATLVGNYRISERWSTGLRWTFRSGMPYTSITGNHENPDFPGYYLPDYGPVNGARADDYHRLDLRLARSFGRRVQGSWFIDVVNAYGRNSGGAAQYKPEAGSSDYKLEEADSLPLLFSIGVKVTF